MADFSRGVSYSFRYSYFYLFWISIMNESLPDFWNALDNTSNNDSTNWQSFFEEEDDALECAMDRLFDTVICLTFSGCSYRGKDRERISLDFQKQR